MTTAEHTHHWVKISISVNGNEAIGTFSIGGKDYRVSATSSGAVSIEQAEAAAVHDCKVMIDRALNFPQLTMGYYEKMAKDRDQLLAISKLLKCPPDQVERAVETLLTTVGSMEQALSARSA